MPLSTSEKTQLQADVQALSDHVNALIEDPIPNPLQVQLDAANAQITQLQADLAAASSTISSLQASLSGANNQITLLSSQVTTITSANTLLQSKIDSAKSAIQAENAADASADAARANALAALG